MPTLKPNGKRLNGKGSSSWITPARRRALYERDGWRCAYCQKDLAKVSAVDRTLDHVIPIKCGGTHENWNLLTACARCNFTKQHHPVMAHCTMFSVRCVLCDRAHGLVHSKLCFLCGTKVLHQAWMGRDIQVRTAKERKRVTALWRIDRRRREDRVYGRVEEAIGDVVELGLRAREPAGRGSGKPDGDASVRRSVRP